MAGGATHATPCGSAAVHLRLPEGEVGRGFVGLAVRVGVTGEARIHRSVDRIEIMRTVARHASELVPHRVGVRREASKRRHHGGEAGSEPHPMPVSEESGGFVLVTRRRFLMSRRVDPFPSRPPLDVSQRGNVSSSWLTRRGRCLTIRPALGRRGHRAARPIGPSRPVWMCS